MKTINKSATQPNVAAEKKHDQPTYYKTLTRSGYAPVNGLQMYYEIHGTVTARPLVTIHPFVGLANVFPSLTRNRQLIIATFLDEPVSDLPWATTKTGYHPGETR